MKFFSDKDIRYCFLAIAAVMAAFLLSAEFAVLLLYKDFSLLLFFLFLLPVCSVPAICFRYFDKQHKTMENAVSCIEACLAGDMKSRIDCDQEGELYKLFHAVNTLAAVLNAHADTHLCEKEFLKNTMSDISHQLKTPLSALNIYNGLIQDEAKDLPEIRELAALSEQELDRIETLVQNLLKIARLDTGSIVLEKAPENVADIAKDIELHFAYRARQEQKALVLSGPDTLPLLCDRDWITEALGNIVKNALDHTKQGDFVRIEWKQFASVVQITVTDNGSGIHPEDIHHIFKRFYRSRFSKDTQGIGLGLPLAKAIVEAHSGTVEVDSQMGVGTAFLINFLIPTKL